MAPIEADERAQLPWHRQHKVMVGHLEQPIENFIGPAIGGNFSAHRAQSTLAGMRNDFVFIAWLAAIKMTAQGRRPAGQNSPHVFENHRPNPSLVRGDEFCPVCCQDLGDAKTLCPAMTDHLFLQKRTAPDPQPYQSPSSNSTHRNDFISRAKRAMFVSVGHERSSSFSSNSRRLLIARFAKGR